MEGTFLSAPCLPGAFNSRRNVQPQARGGLDTPLATAAAAADDDDDV